MAALACPPQTPIAPCAFKLAVIFDLSWAFEP